MAVVNMEGVSKKFGRVKALDEINLTLEPGEILGFIGPNGAGKTTTIRILMGLIRANKGNATIFGRDVWKNAVEIHRRISYVPGDVNLWPNLTGGEVIDLFIRLKGGAEKKYRDDLVERFQLDPRKKCRTYSKGNRQKVALIAALATNSDLYILDEPTSGLDPLMESVFQQCIKEASKKGKSILLSSHILSEVEKLCNRVSIIKEGKIIENGTLAELRHLTRTQVVVETKNPIVGLEDNPHIYNLKKEDEKIKFSVQGEAVGDVISTISDFEIISLECMPPTLEELFISHYSGS